ncbi:conserved hypothetical protein [Neospora caninum Liverpool]|uniref:Uncharacterized protein n=1 Tax=Neospora caninum (strain Liverpool) TaxID=572307 RepID=F0VB28_NEOCL|nr:conserved hypothetical protein [Neospora caninum Liverpool]CBZ50850.1 conserved hypothetical protein [Neospora caninum Liverpool]CEL68152.1 TPA: hypothetical protein BN1204_039250 [Neospora caninum Liverpool]|eukprot:XP_003880883.1 conserved hypothetical protein [Neospora caninum Liverpool]
MKHAIRNHAPQGHQGLLGAPPSGSHPASSPASVPTYPMGVPASPAPVTAPGGSCDCSFSSETHHSQNKDCQRPPPPPPPVSSHVLPTQLPRFVSTTDGAGVPSSLSRRSNYPQGFSPTSSVPVDRPANSSKNLGTPVGSSAPSKKLDPTMIPQVQALMNAARTMQPSNQAKIWTAHEINVAASSPVDKGDRCNTSQGMETQFTYEPATSESCVAAPVGLALAGQPSKISADLDLQATDMQVRQMQIDSFQKSSIREADLDPTTAGLSWRLSSLECGGKSAHEHSGHDKRKGSEAPKDVHRQMKVSCGSATKVPSRGLKSGQKPLTRSDRNNGSCQSAAGKQPSNNDEYTDPAGKLRSATKRISAAEPAQRPNLATSINPQPHRDCGGILKQGTTDRANQQEVLAPQLEHRGGPPRDQQSNKSADVTTSPGVSATDSNARPPGATVVPPSSSSAFTPAPNACVVQ